MNNPIPHEYLTSFSQTSWAMMQQLATGLLTSGDNATNFTRYSKLASVQQNYLQQMGALWVNSAFGSGPVQPAKGDRRFASEVWKKSPYHEFLKQSYLVNARYVNDLIERASLDDKDAGKNAFLRTADPGCAEPVELPCDQSPGAPRFPRSSLRPAATSRARRLNQIWRLEEENHD
jgi:hypothetical protein